MKACKGYFGVGAIRFNLIAVLCLLGATSIISKSLPDQDNIDWFTAAELELVALTNKERASKGLLPLKMNKTLSNVAQRHADNMARHRHLSHTIKGQTFSARIMGSGYPIARAGENVARSKGPLPHVVKMWMDSPEHRKNILNGNFKEIGVGIMTTSDDGDRYLAQVFGTQKTPSKKSRKR